MKFPIISTQKDMDTVKALVKKVTGKDVAALDRAKLKDALVDIVHRNTSLANAAMDVSREHQYVQKNTTESTMNFPQLRMLAEGKQPNIEKIGNAAVKGFILMASGDPDSFGMDSQTSAREVKQGASGYATDIKVYEKGSHVHMIIDFDDCGGDSYNHEDGWVDSAGKFSRQVPAASARGKLVSKHENLDESLNEGKKAKGDEPVIDKAAVLKFLKGCDAACRADVHKKLMKMVEADEAAAK